MTPEYLRELLAVLRAAFITYQTGHWTVSGPAYYGKHLLMQRLYDDTAPQIDGLGERIVGYWGNAGVDQADHGARVEYWLRTWAPIACPIKRSLAAAVQIRNSVQRAYDDLKQTRALTLGLDNFLQGIADVKDTHVYLLQQMLKETV